MASSHVVGLYHTASVLFAVPEAAATAADEAAAAADEVDEAALEAATAADETLDAIDEVAEAASERVRGVRLELGGSPEGGREGRTDVGRGAVGVDLARDVLEEVADVALGLLLVVLVVLLVLLLVLLAPVLLVVAVLDVPVVAPVVALRLALVDDARALGRLGRGRRRGPEPKVALELLPEVALEAAVTGGDGRAVHRLRAARGGCERQLLRLSATARGSRRKVDARRRCTWCR